MSTNPPRLVLLFTFSLSILGGPVSHARHLLGSGCRIPALARAHLRFKDEVLDDSIVFCCPSLCWNAPLNCSGIGLQVRTTGGPSPRTVVSDIGEPGTVNRGSNRPVFQEGFGLNEALVGSKGVLGLVVFL
jgi:hypothetical protein